MSPSDVFAGWLPVPDPLVLDPRAVHVFRIDLGAVFETGEPPDFWLSLAEQQRAARFHSGRHRTAFAAARTALRLLLGGYLGADPLELEFGSGSHGKPFLINAGRVDFNVAHTPALALIAVSGRPVGVDIEVVDAALAPPFDAFSRADSAALRRLPAGVRTDALFTCWTVRESLMKARGDGLTGPLEAADIFEILGRRSLWVTDETARRWVIHRLDPAAGHVGAVTTDAGVDQVRLYDWHRPTGR